MNGYTIVNVILCAYGAYADVAIHVLNAHQIR